MENFLFHDTARYVYYLFVKWVVFKPMTKLCYIVNGKMFGKVRWYQKHYITGRCTWPWLGRSAYKLGKYVMFELNPDNENR